MDVSGIAVLIGMLVGKVVKQTSVLYTKFVPWIILIILYLKNFLTGLGVDPAPGTAQGTAHFLGFGPEISVAAWAGWKMLGSFALAALKTTLIETIAAIGIHSWGKNTIEGAKAVGSGAATVRGPKTMLSRRK